MEGERPTRERRSPSRTAERRLVDLLLDRLDILESRLSDVETKVDNLDGWRNRAIGALVVLVFFATIAGGVIADAIARAVHP